ncbi:tripartite tricarboxylate transporter substrate binding protein [Advenella sp. WQ 585]|uniref:Tripartite tricarboxylate transporter substrate binding protein n=1 Tax=Advenella mandrilli TaxID=2800330 RepID=A0ABS1EAC2_9BURK|nr:tripartite tricarboxylate transporter substrate binding protein [Advenella mandrilli]MBK1779693.1 tripartite tricarboxylate transporter substrate binding protein [Advenella mandrilli]
MKLLKKVILPVALGVFSVNASAENTYPTKPVSMVVPYSAGQIDVFTRALAKGLSEEWKQPLIVENRGGANEAIGSEYVTRAAPDGYTILIATEAAYTLNPMLFKKMTHDPEKQLAPVTMVAKAPFVVVVPASSKANTMQEFIAMAKERSKTDPIRYGSSGVGGVNHLPYITLSAQHNLEMIHVPYKGGAAVLQDVMAGHVESAMLGAGIVSQNLKSGHMKALAVSADERLKELPDVPTFKELGLPDIQANYYLGLAVPTGTPQAVIDKIAETTKKVILTKEFKSTYLDPFGFTAIGSGPKELATYQQKDKAMQSVRIKASGVRFD